MGRDELISFAMKFIEEKGIRGRKELQKADQGLYKALKKRGVLGELKLERKHWDWVGMGRDGLISFAKKFIEEKGIRGRTELKKADGCLHEALRRRNVLDAVFSEAESSKHADAIEDVLEAVKTFGD